MSSSILLYFCAFLYTGIAGYCIIPKINIIQPVHQKHIRTFLWCMVICLAVVLLAALRENIGIDYETYKSQFLRYEYCSWKDIFELKSSREFLNIVLAKAIIAVFGDVKFVFAAYAILTWVLFIYAIKDNSEDINCFVALVVLQSLFFAESFNTIRQMLAVSIVAFDFKCIKHKKIIRFFIGIIIAYFFHNSAIVAVPLYFLYVDNQNKMGEVWRRRLFTFVIILFQLLLPYLLDILNRFGGISYYLTEYEMKRSGLSITIFLKLPIWIISLCYYKRLTNGKPFNKFLYFTILMEALCYIGGIWFKWYTRFSYYFSFGEVLLCASVAKESMKGRIIPRSFISIIIVLYYLFLFWIEYAIWGWSAIFPYTSFL